MRHIEMARYGKISNTYTWWGKKKKSKLIAYCNSFCVCKGCIRATRKHTPLADVSTCCQSLQSAPALMNKCISCPDPTTQPI